MNLSKLDHVDVWTRAGKTALEAFVAAISTSGLSWTHLGVSKSVLVGVAAAVVTAVLK